MYTKPKNSMGWIEIICGSMFSGKTEELIRRIKRAKIANQTVHIFKPKMEIRYHKEKIVSHDDNQIDSTPISDPKEILNWADKVDVIGIDEAQFFSPNLAEVCNQLANNNKRIIIAGLDMDFLGNPFGIMPNLMAMAELVTKVHAICMKCGSEAQFSYRFSNSGGQVKLGEKDLYEPRCRTCFNQGMEKQQSDINK